MAAAGNVGNTVSRFPMGGNIFFAVYLHEIDSAQPTTKNLEDAVFSIKFFKNLGCKIFSGEDSPIDDVEASQSNEDVSSDDSPDEFEEDSRTGDDASSNYKNFVIFNQSLLYTVSDLELFAKGDYGESCFIFYFIVPQVGSKFLTFDESDINVFQLWKIIRKPSIPVIFLIQGNFTGDASNPSVLLNTGAGKDDGPTIAESANVLLAVIPNPVMQSADLDSCDGIFIIVSSHGSKNLITRTYDGVFSTEYIQHKLATCTKLKDKPKVIIRDACRGSREEGRVPYGAYVPSGEDRKDLPVPQGTSKNMNDIIIALASVEGTVAGYDDEGSIFIYHLCEMIRKHDELDFQTILTLTMNEVSSKHKQQVTFTSGLQKLLYFPKVKSQ